MALCAPEVAVGGPQGTGHGHELMRAWLRRSGIRLEPQHPLREVDGRVFVHEHAQWTATKDAPAQAPTDHPVDTWAVFTAADGLVTSVQPLRDRGRRPARGGRGQLTARRRRTSR